jgi:DNA-binding GntR family transcriptional regulator
MNSRRLGDNKTPELPSTISETIYKYLKNSIIEGELEPNQRVQEREIAELFKVSTTPVREAFQRLAAEKYLVINARREVVVASLTLEEINELFEIVRLLDTFALKKALPRLTDSDITEIRDMTEQMGRWHKQKNIHGYVRTNLDIHEKIWKKCNNNLLYQSLVNMGEKYTLSANQIFFLTDSDDGSPSLFNKSYRDHIELLDAIERRDNEAVEEITKNHWGKGFLGNDNTD